MGLTIGNGDRYFQTRSFTNSTKENEINASEKVNGSSNSHSVAKLDKIAHTAYIDGVKIDDNFMNMWLSGKSYDEIMATLRDTAYKKEYKNKDEEILEKIISEV